MTHWRATCVKLLCFGVTAMGGAAWAADPPAPNALTVMYRDKPPYSHTVNGKPAGFLMERTADILRRANVAAVFEEVPVKRITQSIQRNALPICSPGWYKLAEREEFAYFSLPIHEDKPHMVLAGAHAIERVRAAKTLKELFANPELRLGKVSGVSYGAELDGMIATAAQAAMDSTVTPVAMARMVKFKRADYMLIDQEDYFFLNQQGEFDEASVKSVKFPDMPAGLKRHLMCSKSVTLQMMERLDEAIRRALPAQK